jgi:hypothetical protein
MDNIQRYVEHYDMIVARKEAAQKIVVGPTKARVVEGNATYTYDIEAGGLSKQITDNGENYSVYVDKRGDTVRQCENCYYTRKDYEDGSFNIQQSVVGQIDKTVRFGPLSAKLSELFAMGFILRIDGWVSNRNQKLRLIRGSEQYKLAKIPTHCLNQYQDLTMWVRDGLNPHFEPHTVDPKPKEIIKEVRVVTDPFEELMLRYPIRRKTVEFVGNQTLEQYVKQQLREQRRLENV